MLMDCPIIFFLQNQERRHRTAVYVMIVTEELAEWDDARNIGKRSVCFLFRNVLGC